MTAPIAAHRLSTARRAVALSVALCLGGLGLVQETRAALIGTDAVARAAAATGDTAALSPDAARAQVRALLERDEAVQALVQHGVDVAQARERVEALSDQEALDLARRIAKAPAGAGVFETIGFVFVLLLFTDILGFTKVFPFTRSIR